MNRRTLIAGLTGTALVKPEAPQAQSVQRPRIGVLVVGNLEPFWGQFREGLAEFGYVDGQNIAIEFRSAQGKLASLPDLAAELVRLRLHLIVA